MHFRPIALTGSLLVIASAAQDVVIVDNDDGAPAYTETGSWATSGSTGYDGGTYRFVGSGNSSTAVWSGDLAATDQYDVAVWYRHGTNRSVGARYVIQTASGPQAVLVDQTANGLGWNSLGTFDFNAGSATVTLDAAGSTTPGVVISDAVRFTQGGEPQPVLVASEEVIQGVVHETWEIPGPVVAHVVGFDLANPELTIEMGFARGQRNYSSRQTTSQIAARYDSPDHEVIAAINASHFDSGIFIHGPQGAGSNLVSFPTLTWPHETYMLQESGEGFVATDVLVADPLVRFADDAERRFDVFNYPCTQNTLAIYTPDWGPSTGSTAEGAEVIVEDVNFPWHPGKWLRGRIAEVRTGPASVNSLIPPDGFVLAACPGSEADLLAHVTVGDDIEVHAGLVPAIFNNAHVICGGLSGWLVKDGEPFPENWTYGHAPVRHPRTALAWTETRHWFVTFDGRQAGYSIGMTYEDMADFLVNTFQVEHAANLDGGGSTTMVIQGAVVNCPSDGANPPCTGTQRSVPNALLLVRRDAESDLPLIDGFAPAGRRLAWDEKFSFNPVVSFSPSPPASDGHVCEVLNPVEEYETMSAGSPGDADYAVSAMVWCDHRPEVAGDGFERVGIFARDDGNANFESAERGGGNCYALTFDTDTGRIRAGVVVDGVFTDFLESDPVFEATDAWREFRIECSGERIRYLIDGQLFADVSDSNHSGGRVGIGHHEHFATHANALGAHVDDFALEPFLTGFAAH